MCVCGGAGGELLVSSAGEDQHFGDGGLDGITAGSRFALRDVRSGEGVCGVKALWLWM